MDSRGEDSFVNLPGFTAKFSQKFLRMSLARMDGRVYYLG
jgi:hypothetical protein